MTLLLDTSEFAGIPDAHLARELLAEGAIVRGSSGPSHVDKLAAEHIANFAAAGIPTLACYHYFYSWIDGAAQAEHAFRTMRALGLSACFVDFEPVASGTRETDAPHLLRPNAHRYAARWKELTGNGADFYGPIAYLCDLHLDPALFRHAWGAHVNAEKDAAGNVVRLLPRHEPPMPLPGFEIVIHQYHHNAPLGAGRVDWNRTDYTVEQLRAMLGGGT